MQARRAAEKIFNLILVIAVIVVGFHFRGDFWRTWRMLEKKTSPCQRPIGYSLGAYDERFGVPEEDFLKIAAEASGIWSSALEKPLFAYAEDGALKLNLVYDYRQESTVKMKALGIDIDNSQAAYDKLKAKHGSMTASYASAKKSLEAKIADFDLRKKAYEASVVFWNGKGGAPKEAFNKLEQDRIALGAMADDINAAQLKLNALVDDINASVTVLNRLVNDLNLRVDKYNNIGGGIGGEFQEGEYRMAGGEEEINIYQFDNKLKLLRVLAHEFGHALGLEHVDDPKAIMYRLNEGSNDKLTAGDTEALKAVCGAK